MSGHPPVPLTLCVKQSHCPYILDLESGKCVNRKTEGKSAFHTFGNVTTLCPFCPFKYIHLSLDSSILSAKSYTGIDKLYTDIWKRPICFLGIHTISSISVYNFANKKLLKPFAISKLYDKLLPLVRGGVKKSGTLPSCGQSSPFCHVFNNP